MNQFASICGDNNPLHSDPKFAAKTFFGGTIVHGILVSSLFSTLFGRSVHGSVYVSQTLNFKRPVLVGAKVLARMDIKKASLKSKGLFLNCTTTAFVYPSIDSPESERLIAIEGEACVLVPRA